MNMRCKAPMNKIREKYKCDICTKICHNILCGTYSENSSLCSGCVTEKLKKNKSGVDKLQFLKPTKTLPVTKKNEKAGSKLVLEQLVRKEDFGQAWFYKTKNDIKKYAHFFLSHQKIT